MVDNRIKVGFIGCGGIARSLYTDIYGGLADIAQVVAVADLDEGLAQKRKEMLGHAYRSEAFRAKLQASDARSDIEKKVNSSKSEWSEKAADYNIRIYSSHDDLLKDQEVELVCVFTPPVIRSLPIVAAARAGKHVYSEGPFAKSVEEADQIRLAIKTSGVKFHSQVVDRYPRGMIVAQRAIENGLLGKIGSANVELNSYRPQSYYGPIDKRGGSFQPNKWHGTWDGEGGGAVFHHGRYIIDPFLWVVGTRVKEVFAYSGPMLRTIEHDSLTQAVVKYENGATGFIHATLISHLSGNIPGIRGRITLLGSEAAIQIDQEMSMNGIQPQIRSDLTISSNDNVDAVRDIEALRDDLSEYPEFVTQRDQTKLFLESILNDTDPLVPIEIPHHHVEVTRAIYKSAEERSPVTLPLSKDDPFYSFEGRIAGADAEGPLTYSSGHPFN